MITLSERVQELIDQYDTLSEAAKAVGYSAGYLIRLKRGETKNPSENVLKKLGLRRVVSYERIETQ